MVKSGTFRVLVDMVSFGRNWCKIFAECASEGPGMGVVFFKKWY